MTELYWKFTFIIKNYYLLFAIFDKKDIILVLNLILNYYKIMISNQIISISELKTQPSKYINSLKDEWDKYIFVHSKPRAVIMDVKKYEMLEKIKTAMINNNIWFTNDKNIINPINDVFWWNEKDLIFW